MILYIKDLYPGVRFKEHPDSVRLKEHNAGVPLKAVAKPVALLVDALHNCELRRHASRVSSRAFAEPLSLAMGFAAGFATGFKTNAWIVFFQTNTLSF